MRKLLLLLTIGMLYTACEVEPLITNEQDIEAIVEEAVADALANNNAPTVSAPAPAPAPIPNTTISGPGSASIKKGESKTITYNISNVSRVTVTSSTCVKTSYSKSGGTLTITLTTDIIPCNGCTNNNGCVGTTTPIRIIVDNGKSGGSLRRAEKTLSVNYTS